jgi:cytochrome c biogenesis protein CcmG, thiol:disulfide interchange protein DsbE
LDGQQQSLSEGKGRVVVINFWATWCPPCKDEMPLFEKYAQKYPDRLLILGLDQQEDVQTIEGYIRPLGVSFPILMDKDGQVASVYHVHSYPSTFFVDPSGILRAQQLGELSEASLVSFLEMVGIQP